MKLGKKLVAVTAAAGIALTGIFVAAPAHADPSSNSYSIVGSDTLQDVTNALTNGTRVTGSNVRVFTQNKTIGNFDAFGSNSIQAKPFGPFFSRPQGSGGGRNALIASITGAAWTQDPLRFPAAVITDQVDIARSSSGPGSNASPEGDLAFIPFGRDAVAFAYKGGTGAWANLTRDQLIGIYSGAITQIDGVTVKPVLPQTGSGTRDFFLGALGNPTIHSSVRQGVAENDATILAEGEIVPFSVASWVAQSNGASGVNTISGTTNVRMGSALGSTAPFTGTAPALVPNATYYASTQFGRDTFLVVDFAKINPSDPKYDASLATLVKPGATAVTGSLAGFQTTLSSAPGAVKVKFGFLAPSSFDVIRAYPNVY